MVRRWQVASACLVAGCLFDSTVGGGGGGDESPSGSTGSGPSSSPTTGGPGSTSTTGDATTGTPTSTTDAVETDATTTSDGDDRGSTESSSGAPACDGLWWEIDFESDPTTLDVNDDGVLDWVVRNDGTFPSGELSGGVWTVGTHVPLDSRPRDDFAVRTLVDVEMRSIEVGTVQGATFWINVDYGGGTFAPIFAQVRLDGDGDQHVTLFGKSDDATRETLAEVVVAGDDFVRIELDIDVAADEVGLWVDGVYVGTYDYFSFATNGNDDRFATLLAWTTDAEFRHLLVTQCR